MLEALLSCNVDMIIPEELIPLTRIYLLRGLRNDRDLSRYSGHNLLDLEVWLDMRLRELLGLSDFG